MGVIEIFSETAELKNILDSVEHLKVSDVIHKAVIEIDEVGSVAASASGMY